MTKKELWEWALHKGYKPYKNKIIFKEPLVIKGKNGNYIVTSIKNDGTEFSLYSNKPKSKYSGRLAK